MVKDPRNVSARALAIVAGTLVFGPGVALASMAPPDVGSQYSFDCSVSDGPSFRETYSVVSHDGDIIRVEVDGGLSKNWYEKPYYLTGTTLVTREKIGDQTGSMGPSRNDFADLRQLQVGSSYSSYVLERRSSGERLNWRYKVSLTGRELAYVRSIGDVEVVAINERRWVDLYSSSMLTHYAPQLRFPVYWNYRDSNGATVECNLAAVANVSVQASAAPEPVVEPEPVVRVAPEPEPVPRVKPRTQTAAVDPAPSTSGAGAGASLRPAERLARLEELRSLGLITEEEYKTKRRAISGGEAQTRAPSGSIEDSLRDANRRFRQNQLSPEEFVTVRAEILKRISPSEMDPKRALILLDDLLKKRLISKIEHSRKRQAMIAAL